MQERMKVGPTRFMPAGGMVKFGRYENGVLAIQIIDDKGEPIAMASVNMPMEPVNKKSELWLKGWSENEGIPVALEKAGVVELTGETQIAGFSRAQHARLTAAAYKQAEEEGHGG